MILFNIRSPFLAYEVDDSKIVKNRTFLKQELSDSSNGPFPYFIPARGANEYEAIRKKGVVEKCKFCDHRVEKGMVPACVVGCPADA